MNHTNRTTLPLWSSVVAASLLWFVLPAPLLQAQQHDWRGYEFWVAFMENQGSGTGERSDLRLYLSCDQPTSVRITFHQTGQQQTIPLLLSNTTVEVDINALFGDDVELVPPEREGEISRRALHVLAEEQITLYGVNIRNKSSDAFLGLPDDVLTRSYIVMAFSNGYERFTPGGYDMPSEFAVVATEDGTTVGITPAPGALINGRSEAAPFTVVLNRGEVFFAQARIGELQDLSGTEVISNKPVAVFGGVRRASVPVEMGNYRDHLCEQIPPLEVWGDEAFLLPFYPVTPSSTQPAVARILASVDGTNWQLDGVPQAPLRRGYPVELQLRNPQVINADAPILVGQYEHSIDVELEGDSELGDPFMMLIPSSSQFDTVYAFQAIDHNWFVRHYINVVISTAAVPSLLLDDAPLTATFQQFGGTGFSYAQIQVTPGAHYIRADSPFGLYSYGYGHANSYGYAGGSRYDLVHDYQRPDVVVAMGCGELTGTVRDDRQTDSGIDSCYVLPEETNVQVRIEPFIAGADTVTLHARLVDPYEDGHVAVRAVDSGGRSTTYRGGIPGHTVRVAGAGNNAIIRLDTLVLFNGNEFCRTIELENYGAYSQTIDSVALVPDFNGRALTRTQLPVVIPPGGKARFYICVRGWSDTVLPASLFIGDSCRRREVAVLPVVGGIDTNAPVLVTTAGRCTDEVVLSFAEVQERFSGVVGVTFDTLINCSGTYRPGEEKFPVAGISVTVRRIDPREDFIYHITVVDAAGNRRTAIDTIGGFTLAVAGRDGERVSTKLDREWIGDSLAATLLRCDSVTLRNYGNRALRISGARALGNLFCSIPLSQFPITIPPRSERRLQVCIEGRQEMAINDTIEVIGECGHQEIVALKVPLTSLYASGTDFCNSMIQIERAAARRTFMTTPVPNPASDAEVSVDIGLTGEEQVRLELVGLEDGTILPLLRDVILPSGVTRLGFDLSSAQSGAYLLRLQTGSGSVCTAKIIIIR